ncbi:MAG: hypothetical protein WA080_02565 [Sulfuricurvum sp.]
MEKATQKQELLNQAREKPVKISVFGCDINIKKLSVSARDELIQMSFGFSDNSIVEKEKINNFREFQKQTITLCVCDDKGNTFLTKEDLEEFDEDFFDEAYTKIQNFLNSSNKKKELTMSENSD